MCGRPPRRILCTAFSHIIMSYLITPSFSALATDEPLCEAKPIARADSRKEINATASTTLSSPHHTILTHP